MVEGAMGGEKFLCLRQAYANAPTGLLWRVGWLTVGGSVGGNLW